VRGKDGIWMKPMDEYLTLIADLVAQHCYEENGIYESGCISVNAEAICLLCDKGWMVMVNDGIGRNCSARFKVDGPISGFTGNNPVNA